MSRHRIIARLGIMTATERQNKFVVEQPLFAALGKQVYVDLSPFFLVDLNQIDETQAAEIRDDPVEPWWEPAWQSLRERAGQVAERGLEFLFRDGGDQVYIALKVSRCSRQRATEQYIARPWPLDKSAL
jgi:hypothetical protein